MKRNLKEMIELANAKRIMDNERVSAIIAENNMKDEDGYPTAAAHEAVEIWDPEDIEGWLAFIESLWWGKAYGAWYRDSLVPGIEVLDFSTMGWSGNEGLIKSMQKNPLWYDLFYSHIRGGHYSFEIVHEDKDGKD